MRGVTVALLQTCRIKKFLLTRLMRGVTQYNDTDSNNYTISTHTPHARRDRYHVVISAVSMIISTHTPHARRDGLALRTPDGKTISTHTPHARRDVGKFKYF